MPAPGSPAERAEFERLQARLPQLFDEIFRDQLTPRTVVVVPGLSLDPDVLGKIDGVQHYEERMLSMLMLLRLPNLRLLFLSSEPISGVTIDYYLHLLGGVPPMHARKRLFLFSPHDGSPQSLTRKLLSRPRLLARVRAAIENPATAHLSVFNSTCDEVSLAVALGIPMYACDPELGYWGGKSGSRRAFREAGISLPPGAEDLRDLEDAAEAIAVLRSQIPDLRRVVLKIDQGFSGDGNALLNLPQAPGKLPLSTIRQLLQSQLQPEANDTDACQFAQLYQRQGGIVEAWIEGKGKRTPSVQARINPLGGIELISSHEQLMGGRSGQVFLGSQFPASAEYARQLHPLAVRVGEVLRERGVIGRFSVDFISVPTADGWQHHAIEINLRKGGTTLPYQMLQFLTDGNYCAETAQFITPSGLVRCYHATDNLVNPDYRRLIPHDLVDLIVQHRLHFDQTRQRGAVFSLIGALSRYGKLGLVSIDETPQAATAQFEQVRALLDHQARL
ncbi:carboxylate-amine ligase [Lysobacteraceae bacterium NML07-0707]|nr:carboxylate-amine ligase [Xanthomonadaceae bacterium NML07-0707]